MRLHSFPSRFASKKAYTGFTLVEMLIVIALIAIVATLTITNLGSIFGSKQEESAEIFVNQSIKTPIMAYRTALGSYPTTAEGFQALVTAPTGKEARWKGPYIDKMALDPWKNPYQYRCPGVHNPRSYDAWSIGPDQIDGTPDDIGNW